MDGFYVIPVHCAMECTTPRKARQRKACKALAFSAFCRNCSTFALNGKEKAQARKSGVEQLHRSMPDFEQSKRSAAERTLITLQLTAEQLGHVAFAVYCQTEELTEGHEADEPEVQAAVRCLGEVSAMCTALKKAVQS